MADKPKTWARLIKRDTHTVHFPARDPRVLSYAKALALLVAEYERSPIDLILDFVPVTGYLDDAIRVPLGLVVKAVPSDMMAEHSADAAAAAIRPVRRLTAAVVVLIRIAPAALTLRAPRCFYPRYYSSPNQQAGRGPASQLVSGEDR